MEPLLSSETQEYGAADDWLLVMIVKGMLVFCLQGL